VIRGFRDLVVWQRAIELFEEVVTDAESFPKTEVGKIITNQILRSIGSISANIAEGYGRRKGREYEHYLYVARGSCSESIDWFEKLKRLNYISPETFRQRESICLEIIAMLSKMINTLEGGS
jgi:four helix bundle protein